MNSKLLILDLNGILVDKKYIPSSEKYEFCEGEEHFSFGDFVVFLRKGCLSLLRSLSEKYTLAIWSSTHRKNVEKILENFLPEYKNLFKFVWCREKTLLDPEYDIEEKNTTIKKFDTIKPIDLIIHDPILNENRMWGLKNILIVDNSESKLRFNDSKNTLIIPLFDAEKRDTFSFPENIEKVIEDKFEKMTT